MAIIPGTVALVRFVHPANTPLSMLVTVKGRLMLVSPVQFRNASLRMVTTPTGTVIFPRLKHPENACVGMLEQLVEKMTLVRLVQS